MDDEDHGYLDDLSERRAETLRGNPPGISPRFDDQHYHHYGNVPLTMAATAPDFIARPRSFNRRDPKSLPVENPVEAYWFKNRPVLQKTEWSSIHVKLPVVAPTTAHTKIKNSIFSLLTNRLEAAEGHWKDKTELFASLYNDHVPAADIEATLAISDMDDYNTTVFEFVDFQLLDSDYRTLANGTNLDYSARTRTDCRFFKFTLDANPRNIDSAGMNVNAALFPSPVTTTVYLRALRHLDSLHPHITKLLVQNTPKILIAIYQNNNQDFSLAQKTLHEYAPNPDTQKKWLNTLKAKTKYEAMKQLVRNLYLGRLEGTERLASRIERIKQRAWEASEKRFKYKSVTELSQDYQFELQEVTPTTAHDELPDLENSFYRALSNDLQTRVIDHIHPAAATTLIQNIARFNEFVSLCLQEETALKTITGVAERAVLRQTRNAYQHRTPVPRGPRTFITTHPHEGQYTPPGPYSPTGHFPPPTPPVEPNPYIRSATIRPTDVPRPQPRPDVLATARTTTAVCICNPLPSSSTAETTRTCRTSLHIHLFPGLDVHS
jgi:hypothetical protein